MEKLQLFRDDTILFKVWFAFLRLDSLLIEILNGELESVRIEYANAQLEYNAADERSQILASEVISLEDTEDMGWLKKTVDD
ncbi:unnamed protein product [Arabidopsis lyrata]|nr:unnamed protein product [Arabidopsis lyrata]